VGIPGKSELDFIVIGAQKAGTTALFEYLRRHPRLALPAAKELPYFSHDASLEHGWEEYLAKAFPVADPTAIWGTVTPHYMVGGLYQASPESRHSGAAGDERTVPARIAARLPGVRLIAVLRDPVERASSHHRMMVMEGHERRSFDEAVAELLTDAALEQARREPAETTGYVVWGEYGRILGGYLDVFDREQLLVVYSSDLRSRARETMTRVHEFLGIEDVAPENLGETYRVGASARRLGALNPYGLQASAANSRALRALWRALPNRMRRRADHAFQRTSYNLDLWNRRSEPTDAPDGAASGAAAALREHFGADAQRLTELLGVAPPWMAETTDSYGRIERS
jgi:hypothetical protein